MRLRPAIAAALALTGCAALGCGYSIPKEDEWRQLRIGMSQDEVVEILGPPYMAQGSQLPGSGADLYLFSDTTKFEEGDRYAYYAVRFQNGRVVEKHRYLTKLPPDHVIAEVNRARMIERERVLGGGGEPRADAEQPASVPREPAKGEEAR